MIRGERFEIDLEDGEEPHAPQNATRRRGAFIGDILERQPASAVPPTAPTLKSNSGFPQHKKRVIQSRFKQQQNKQDVSSNVTATPPVSFEDKAGKTWEEEEKQRIDQENRKKLAQMSTEEIEEERQELMNSLSPALLQRLLQRSNIESGTAEADLSQADTSPSTPKKKLDGSRTKTVSFADPALPTEEAASLASAEEDHTLQSNNYDLETPLTEPLLNSSIHFPQPPQPPSLDPSSPTFLTDLHTKYFPSLPSDPSKLEWMQPPSSSSQPSATNTYDPSAQALKPKDLRFSFRGELIPPKLAAEIPVTMGLHHHADAPEAAGYTIPELAHLAQSSVPAQRCLAFQTLGRILYRLGRGEFGDSGESELEPEATDDANPNPNLSYNTSSFGDLARGLWSVVDKERVIEILTREADGKGVDGGRHVSAKAYAVEAVWLWQRGGGRMWKAE